MCRHESSSKSGNAHPNSGITGFEVGDAVLIAGTGKWWRGSCFRATVADVREGDGTIKVRYADGGYKRFSLVKFEALVKADDMEYAIVGEHEPEDVLGAASRPACRTEAAFERQESCSVRDSTELSAERNRDVVRRKRGRLKIERAALAEAINRRDFMAAYEIDLRLRELEDVAPVYSPQWRDILQEAGRKAVGGGLAGAAAMAVQVISLMWLRTTLYYQYRYGLSTGAALHDLYKQGGVRRFYQGLGPALLQGPLSRFGDTAGNIGALVALDSSDAPAAVKTLASASLACLWRMCLMPLDTLKTMLQVEGTTGFKTLSTKVDRSGILVLFHGGAGLALSSFVGHFTWFGIYNYCDTKLPVPTDLAPLLARNATLGLSASVVTDILTNPLRVLKTYRQTVEQPISYLDAAVIIIKNNGLWGLFGRGLGTRFAANGLQAALFSVTWKYFQEKIETRNISC